jgi:hypothetical protein
MTINRYLTLATTEFRVELLMPVKYIIIGTSQILADICALPADMDETILLHDRSLSSAARDESRMAGGEPRMTGDCCRPERSINRCVRTHSHLYSYIYGLVALLDNIQSSFSKYHYFNRL